MHDTATIMESRLICNTIIQAMIFRERCTGSCDWRTINNCTLNKLNREPVNLIRYPALRVRRWIRRGRQYQGKGMHRSLWKALQEMPLKSFGAAFRNRRTSLTSFPRSSLPPALPVQLAYRY